MNAVEAGLYTRLTAAATTLYGLVGTRVYNTLAPQGATKPYVLFASMAGSDQNETPQDRVEHVYLVKGVAATLYAAGAIDDAIRERLHQQELTVTGWTMLACFRENEVRMVEEVSGAPAFHAGATYRITIGE